MKTITMKLSDLVRPEKNTRIHTEQQLKEFERSVSMFGQIRPIVVDENNVILAGNGLYDTLIRMGKDTADVYQYNDLTENQKKKLMIADNKIFSLGIENLDTLNSFLEELQGDLDIPGYDEEILKQMVSDAEEITEKISEYGRLDEDEIQSIRDRPLRQGNAGVDPAGETPAEGIGEQGMIPADGSRDLEQMGDAANVRRFIICPKCGEKIWL